MNSSAARFDKIASNFVTSEVHRSSPTIGRLHELLKGRDVRSVCDVACGAGHLGLSFAGIASRFVAVDPAPRMLEAAAELAREAGVPLQTFNSPAESLPLDDGQFDLTASRLAPHHFSDVYRAMGEMARVTRPGGVVAVIDLQGDDNPSVDKFNHRLEILHDPTHIRSYTLAAWQDVFEKAGLTIRHLEPSLSERPGGVPVKRWCEIASSGAIAECEINRLLGEADPNVTSALGIREEAGVFFMPMRTVLIVAERAD